MRLRKFPLIAGRSFLNYEYRWTWIRRYLNDSYTIWPPLGKQNRGSFKKTFSLIWDFLLCYFFWAFFQLKLLCMWVLSSLLRRGPGKERKRERAGHDGKGKREERLPRFPSFHPSPRGFYFSIIAIFIGTPSGSLCGEELALSIVSPPPPPRGLTIQCNYTLFTHSTSRSD